MEDASLKDSIFSLCHEEKKIGGSTPCVNCVLYKHLRLMGSESSNLLRGFKFDMPFWLWNHSYIWIFGKSYIVEYRDFYMDFLFVSDHDPPCFHSPHHTPNDLIFLSTSLMFVLFFTVYKTLPLYHSTHETSKNSHYFHVIDDKYCPI